MTAKDPLLDVDSGSEDEWDDVEEETLTEIPHAHSGAAQDLLMSELPTIPSLKGKQTGASERVAVSWDLVSKFSFEGLKKTYQAHAPTTWHVLSRFVAPKPVKKLAKRKSHLRRPK